MVTVVTTLLFGLLLGMRHAVEPDHLAAVSVLVARSGTRSAGALVGALWGLGHTLTLFAVGCVLAGIGSRLPVRLTNGFEILVAAMLVTLGFRAIARGPFGSHHHHPEFRRAPDSRWRWAGRPLVVGAVHGLAGSGAITALVFATLPTAVARLGYIVLFGLGSVVGMASLTTLAGWPLARVEEGGRTSRWISGLTGSVSLLLGAIWGWSAFRAVLRA